MAQLRSLSWAAAVPMVLAAAGCVSTDTALQQHQRKLRSLASSAQALGEEWLSGTLSSRFTATALERTFRLVEEERQALAADPQTLASRVAGELAEAATRQAQAVARLAADVRQNDRTSFLRDLSEIGTDRNRAAPAQGGRR